MTGLLEQPSWTTEPDDGSQRLDMHHYRHELDEKNPCTKSGGQGCARVGTEQVCITTGVSSPYLLSLAFFSSLLGSARLGSILGPLQALARLCDDRENQPLR